MHSEADYDNALARVNQLMDELSGPDGQIDDENHQSRIELDSLVTLIEEYECEHHPIGIPDRTAAI
ncbi:MAG: transcriptional regulator [Chloroflexi bacterium]|nr:transcriptional regulator [Chloroflexota bacterium]MYD49753.1 transcriptional regulator [Chloroflexota bacterium]